MGPPEHAYRGKRDSVQQRDSEPTDRPFLLPARIRIRRHAFVPAFTHDSFDLAESGCLCERSFVYLDLITIFQRAEQLNASQRIELEVNAELCRRIEFDVRFSADVFHNSGDRSLQIG